MDIPKKTLIVRKISNNQETNTNTTVSLAPKPTVTIVAEEQIEENGAKKTTPSITKIKPKINKNKAVITSSDADDLASNISIVSNLTEVEDIYQDKDLREHIYTLPDTYIGGVDPEHVDLWVVDELSNRMVMNKLEFIPGLYKIYDEILVNAIDQHVRTNEKIKYRDLLKAGKVPATQEVPSGDIMYRPVKNIRISVSVKDNRISIENDGDGIDVEIHKKLGIYVPQMIFGKLLTSANYKEGVKRIVGGKNGYGAKLTNIFSKEFTIETVDAYRKRRYKQTFRNNMIDIGVPEIEEGYKKVPFTRISFVPDLARFKLNGLDGDIIRIMKKRAYDTAAFVSANVYWNDVKIETKSFERYIDMYIGGKTETKRHYAQPDERWEICACSSTDHTFMQASIVNGICTSKGGKHVEYIANQITKKLAEYINSKKKGTDLKPQHIRNNMFLFVKCSLENPSFDTQTKECVTSKVADFGSKCIIDDDFIVKLSKTDIGDKAMALSDFKEGEKLKNTSVSRHKILHEKLEDGSYCGTPKKATQCTLILTEGDSAKTFAVSGLKALGEERRKYYGIFPLRGKLLNVRDATVKQINDNEEIIALRNIIGLQIGKDYSKDSSGLRYGAIMILTDQDEDGSHIKGLLFNFFHHFWPTLLKRNTAIKAMNTPLLRVWKMKKKGLRKIRDPDSMQIFYAERDYEVWKELHKGEKGWQYKYYKGLGTNTPEEAAECFKALKIVNYVWDKDNVTELDLASDAVSVSLTNTNTNTNTTANTNNNNNNNNDIHDTVITDTAAININTSTEQEPSLNVSSCSISNTSADDNDNDDDNENDADNDANTGAGTLFVNKTRKGPRARGMVINGMNRTDYTLNLAFKKGFEDSRKDWIQHYGNNITYDFNVLEETYSDFINKRLVSFSYEDCVRSIPSICDGLKPGQRKIIYSVQKKKLKTDIKVAQLSSYVAERTDYHHGELSLQTTIVGLAQDYVGSNNINLLLPAGMFGTRMGGSAGSSREGVGKDHASARYIYTCQSAIMPYIFKESDNPLYSYLKVDNRYIEPKHYLPILPMILINGSAGIGTGYSTTLPCYNPLHVTENILQMMAGNPPIKMTPWYRGFKGEINVKTTKSYTSHGVYRSINADQLEILELPISDRMSFMRYKAYILSILTNKINLAKDGKEKKIHHELTGKIVDVDFDITDTTFKAVITFATGQLQNLMSNPIKFEKDFRLITTINCTNMYLFDSQGKLKKYDTVEEILSEYYHIRLSAYDRRKEYILDGLRKAHNKISAKAQFISDIHDGKICINETVGTKNKPKKKAEIEQQLVVLNYPKFGSEKKQDSQETDGDKKINESDEMDENEDDVKGDANENANENANANANANETVKDDDIKINENATYDYLLSMRIDSLTEEMLKKLEDDRNLLYNELITLEAKTPQGIWTEELEAFKAMYAQVLDEWHDTYKIIKPDTVPILVKKSLSFKKNPPPTPKKVLILKKHD